MGLEYQITTKPEEAEVIVPVAEPLPEAAIAERMAKALAGVEPATLDGYNAFHKYGYTSIGQIRSLANRALSRAGIAVIPSVLGVKRQEGKTEKGGVKLQTAVQMEFHVVAPEGRFTVQWFGESDDTSDKGLAKAITAATKSFLLNFLLVPMAQAEEDMNGKSPTEPPPESPAETPAQQEGAPPPVEHWISKPEVRPRFWAWTHDLGLSNMEVHAALGVESVKDFQGTMAEAKARIEAWIDEEMEQQMEQADAEGQGDMFAEVQFIG